MSAPGRVSRVSESSPPRSRRKTCFPTRLSAPPPSPQRLSISQSFISLSPSSNPLNLDPSPTLTPLYSIVEHRLDHYTYQHRTHLTQGDTVSR